MNWSRKASTAALFLLLSIFSGSALVAQTLTTGDIAGTVADTSGAVVPNATVVLKSDETGETRTLTTGDTGQYRFTTLRPGPFKVSASTPGLRSNINTISVGIGQVVNLNLTLSPEQATEVVSVTDTAPLLQSENANMATSFNSAQLENLPAPGNDMTAYAFNAPGVTISTGGGYGSFSAFGLPAVSNLFTINGNDNMDPYLNLNNSGASNLTLGSNELSEAVVVLNGYTGQYGRQAGANVNYITKSGTNQFHGNAGWQYNGRVMNANDWFNNATGTARPFAISNEWVASIGGPISIPKLFSGKDRLFFFVDNEGLRYVLAGGGGAIYIPTVPFQKYVLGHLQATNPASVPFYTTALNLYAGSSGAARAVDVTPALDAQLGCGNFSGTAGFGTGGMPCARTFRSTVNNLNTEWLMAARVDYNISSKDKIYFRYNTDHGVQATGTDPINSAFNANSVQPSYGGQFGYTRVVSSNQVNQLLLSASYYTATFGPPNLSAALGVFPTTFNFTDGLYSALGGSDNSYPEGRKVRQWQLVDDYSINAGRHTIKFGTNIRQNFISTYAYGSNTSGLYTFTDMNDFVNGNLANESTYSQAFTTIGAEPLSLYSAGFYGQDEWKVAPNFMLTMAVRFDRNSNIKCYSKCFNELVAQPFGQLGQNASLPYNAAIKTGNQEAFPDVEPVVIAPRVGMAWNVTPHTVLRGGFGIFSDLYQGLIADRLITNSPAVASFTTSAAGNLVAIPGTPGGAQAAVASSAAAFESGFAQGYTVTQLSASVPGFNKPNFNSVAKKLYNPKFYEWNVELQQELTHSTLLSLNYVGNKGYQEVNQILWDNAYAPNGFAGLPTAPKDSRFGEIRELNNNGYSNYNGLVAGLRFRMTNAFTGSFNYTWSHALDTCSNACLEPFNALTSVSFRYQLNPAGLALSNYGNADYDSRHSLNANYLYTMPSFFHNALLKGALGGWNLAGTFFYHSGYPFSIVNTGIRGKAGIKNASGIATEPILADIIAPTTSSCTTPNVSCFNTADFATASAQRDIGNSGRNSFRGPGYFDTDLNVNKVFTFHERAKLLIGAYFFNILNHPNFDLPTNNISSGAFGTISQTVSAPTSAYGSFQGSAVSGRVIQTQVKLTF